MQSAVWWCLFVCDNFSILACEQVQKNPDGHYVELAQVKEEVSPTEEKVRI